VPYNEGFKARMIQRMAGPEGITATALSREVGIGQPTLSRWLRERSLGGMMTDDQLRTRRTWTATEKLRVVQEASQLKDDKLGELLRREGIHEANLAEWTETGNAGALARLAPAKRSRSRRTPEQKRIDELEKELTRKEKALAEVTALLVLKKKVQELWGDGDDDTDTRRGT